MVHAFTLEALEDRLPEFARAVIEQNTKLPAEEKARFYEQPDAVEEHEPLWHQYGIITHTKQFRESYDGEAARAIKAQGLEKTIVRHLSQTIDGTTKGELLRLSIPLHDIGKFDKGPSKNEYTTFDFEGHEAASEKIILETDLANTLHSYGLTDKQLEYVAKCAGNHYQLAFLRDEAKKSEEGYTLKFTRSERFKEKVKERLPMFEGFETEAGLLYLGDGMAKTGIIIPGRTDEEIAAYKQKAEQEVQEKGLHENLVLTVMQRPVNISAAIHYLKTVLER